jgi:arabinofuranosyltransferase
MSRRKSKIIEPREGIILLLLMGVFVIHAINIDFIQDDSFISYRYAKNLINGHGLVFNPGERVEGYTNFLWIILLSLFARAGLDMLVVSRVLGVAFGAISLFMVYKISSLFFPKKDWIFAFFTPLLLVFNSALAYWSISGMETSLFLMLVLLTIYLYFHDQRLVVLFCVLATLTRPEGVLVFAIILFHKLFIKKDGLINCLSYLGGFILLLLPFLIFKIFYYGEILPNTFYAKTGFGWEYIQSGLDYFWLFLKHYGLWGILYLLPIVFYKSWGQKFKLLFLFTCVYTLYVILIGGDALKVHRFFLPVMPWLFLFLSMGLGKLAHLLIWQKARFAVTGLYVVFIAAVFFVLPKSYIREAKTAENGLLIKMRFWAETLNRHYGANFTIAASTIGALSYYTDARVIDMIGLTDKYIPRHPEQVPGIISGWRERKFNTQYLLSQDPDFILFSTGRKPTAPAEKALFLNSKFRQGYYLAYFIYQGSHHSIFRRKDKYTKRNEVFEDPQFVNLYQEAINLEMYGRYEDAVKKLNRAIEIGPKDFASPYELMGEIYYRTKDYFKSEEYLRKAIEMDKFSLRAYRYLAMIYDDQGKDLDSQKMLDSYFKYNPEP